MLTDKEKSEITNTLIQKIKFFECPMCHSHNFTIVDGYISQYLQAKINSIKLEGSILPSIAIVCTNCGFTAYHNIGILGVLSNLNIKLSDIDIERLKTWVNGSGTFSFTRHLGNNVQYIFSNKSYTANGNK